MALDTFGCSRYESKRTQRPWQIKRKERSCSNTVEALISTSRILNHTSSAWIGTAEKKLLKMLLKNFHDFFSFSTFQHDFFHSIYIHICDLRECEVYRIYFSWRFWIKRRDELVEWKKNVLMAMAERIKKSLHIVNFFSHHFLTLKSLEIEWKLEVEIFLFALVEIGLDLCRELPYFSTTYTTESPRHNRQLRNFFQGLLRLAINSSLKFSRSFAVHRHMSKILFPLKWKQNIATSVSERQRKSYKTKSEFIHDTNCVCKFSLFLPSYRARKKCV